MVQNKISNRFLSEIAWENISRCTFSISNHVDIWRINISSNLTLLQCLSTVLTDDELARAARYIHAHDRDRFIISRGAIKFIMGSYLDRQPLLIEIESGLNKKPFIKESPLFYNISHSGDWIVLAVSDSEIGIDTEVVNHSFDFNDITTEYFSPDESRFINEAKSPDRFFMLWTRKEALIKATAKGLDDDLKFIPSLDGTHYLKSNILSFEKNWIVTTFILFENYFASIACSDKQNGLRFYETNLQLMKVQ